MQTQQTTPETRQEPSTPAPETPIFELGSKKRKKRRRIIAIAVVVVLAALLIVPRLAGGGPANTPQSSYVLDTVSRRDITVVVSGSAALEPADSYVVNALVGGEILSADFEEGDVVEKGALLYQIDTGDVENSIERSRLSVERAQMSYDQALDGRDDLVIEANESGVIVELMVEEGDSISMGQTIASIRDSATMTLRLPFPSDDAQSFAVGQAATVTLDSTFETLNGTVTEIAPVDEVLAGNVMVRNVTIEVQNPGGIAPQSMASAMVGTAACTQSAAFEYQAETTVTASAAGTVDALL